MSGDEDRILSQIKPVIEKMVMDITRKKPTDTVTIIIIINIYF
jgi:hypothetical protein